MLNYQIKKDALVVQLSGELDHSAATRMRGELDALRQTEADPELSKEQE